MQFLTNKFLSVLVAAFVMVPMFAAAASADAPTRYYVPNYGKAAKKPAAKKVARKASAKKSSAVVTNWGGPVRSASSKPVRTASSKKHANYQRRVPSGATAHKTGSGDYLHQVGGNARWAPGKTIRVYVQPGKASYKNIVAGAMNKWSRATSGAFNWTLTGSPASADYTIGWHASQRQVSSGTEAGLTTTNTMVDPYSGAETIDSAHTRVLTRYNGRALSDAEVAETTLHEIGHALGLEGHSSNPRDIMYYAATRGQGGLTARDMNTISRLYR